MSFKKKYLKYKQKYLLEKQYGGMLSDDIASIVPYIQKLERYPQITLPPELISDLDRLIQQVKAFYSSQLPHIQQIQEREQQMQGEVDCSNLPDIIIKMLWVGFYKCMCDTITNEHRRIMSGSDDSRIIRQDDIHIKLQAVHHLLSTRWDYYLPPLIHEIFIHPSHLTEEMLYSEKYAHKNHVESKVQEPRYGFVDAPYIEAVTHHSYEEFVDAYRRYQTSDDHHMGMEKIAEDIDYAKNKCISDIYGYSVMFPEVSYNIPQLLNDKYAGKTYKQVFEEFPLGTFINLEPQLEYHDGIHVSISTLYYD